MMVWMLQCPNLLCQVVRSGTQAALIVRAVFVQQVWETSSGDAQESVYSKHDLQTSPWVIIVLE
jgi:hypothetical protein